MTPLLFLSALPLSRPRHHRRPCITRRRPYVHACASDANLDSKPQPEDVEPEWMRELAQSLAPDVADTPRPSPQWQLPDDDNTPTTSAASAAADDAWKLWNTSMQQPPVEADDRDDDGSSNAEFWKDAARGVVPDDLAVRVVQQRQDDIIDEPPQQQREGDVVEAADDDDDLGEDGTGADAWDAWNSAIEKEALLEVQPRDPKAETDFWRSTARNLTDNAPPTDITAGDATVSSSKTSDSRNDTEDDTTTADSSEIWQLARGVTGEMMEMQDRLRSELDRYNAEEDKEQYRDIARELVGPVEDEPWEDREPKRASDAVEAEAGSGWNPDVDWLRFEDMRRDQVLQHEKDRRAAVEREAATRREAFERDAADAGGDVVDENGDTAEGVMHTDQSVSKDFLAGTQQLPGFLRNKFRGGGTYGGGFAGAEEMARDMQAKGELLRDPKADAEMWRGAARELTGDAGAAKTGRDVDAENGEIDEVQTVDQQLDGLKIGEEDISADEEDVDEEGVADAELSWSSWRRGAANWAVANREVRERDPKQEVDMWRSSARELTGDASAVSTNGDVEAGEGRGVAASGGSAWDAWRAADAKWKSGIDNMADSDWRQAGETTGFGMPDAAVSDSEKWEQWNYVAGAGGRDDRELWWNTKIDRTRETGGRVERDVRDNRNEWRAIARETSGVVGTSEEMRKGEGEGSVSREERVSKDVTVEWWRAVAKDIMSDAETAETEE